MLLRNITVLTAWRQQQWLGNKLVELNTPIFRINVRWMEPSWWKTLQLWRYFLATCEYSVGWAANSTAMRTRISTWFLSVPKTKTLAQRGKQLPSPTILIGIKSAGASGGYREMASLSKRHFLGCAGFGSEYLATKCGPSLASFL